MTPNTQSITVSYKGPQRIRTAARIAGEMPRLRCDWCNFKAHSEESLRRPTWETHTNVGEPYHREFKREASDGEPT